MDRSSLPADAPPLRPPADPLPDGPSVAVVDGPAVAVVDGPAVAVVDGPVAVADPPPVGALAVPVREPAPDPAPETPVVPPHRSRVGRVADHVAAISDDLQEWVELKVALVRREVLDKVQQVVDAAKLAVPGLVLVLAGLLFLLLTLAFAIGALIESVWGGFGIVTLLLLVAGAVLLVLAKRAYENPTSSVERPRAPRPPAHPRDDADAERLAAGHSAP